MTSNADRLMNDLREIRDTAKNAPERVSVDALDTIHARMDALVTFLEDPEYVDVVDQLADLPGLRVPYHGVNATAERIVDFIASQPDGRATGIEHWVLVHLQERAAIRRREEIAEVMRHVAVNHLYPALRDIGIGDPEGTWELRGRWES